MGGWWETLSTLEQVLYAIAIPATFILVIQLILILIGFADGGQGIDVSDTSGLGDSDFDTDGSIDGDMSADGSAPNDFATFHFFTVQGFVAMLSIFGWSSLTLLHMGVMKALSIGVGVILGFLVMLFVAFMIHSLKKLAQNGSLEMKNCLGLVGQVYLPIPPKGEGIGKVNVVVQGQLTELEAVQEGSEKIGMNEQVRVVDLRGSQMVVEKTE